MNSEHIDSKLFVTIGDRDWRRGKEHGVVAVQVAINSHPYFCKLAVLVHENRALSYAALLIGSDQWLHFRRLHPWMYPLVEEFLAICECYGRVAEIVEEAHCALRRKAVA